MSLLLLVPVGAARSVQRVPGARWDPERRAVSTGVVVGHRAVPCWPFPNQRGGKHASLARPVTKHAGQVEPKMGKLAKMGPEIWGGLPAELAAPAACPSFKPKRISSLLCRPGPTKPRLGPHDLVHGPGDFVGVLAELTVSKFPQGFTFLRLFFALRVHPLFGMERTPPSRLCPGSQRDWSPSVMTDSSARADVQGLRSIYEEDGRTDLHWLSRCQSTLKTRPDVLTPNRQGPKMHGCVGDASPIPLSAIPRATSGSNSPVEPSLISHNTAPVPSRPGSSHQSPKLISSGANRRIMTALQT